MITYQLEDYSICRNEIDKLLPLHYEEIAINKDVIPLDKDEAAYKALADNGNLHIITVRLNGILIGYHASVVKTHLHYKSTLCAFVDVYYLLPEHRKGFIGVNMFKKAEESLKQRGVVKIFSGTKKHLDMSKLFSRLGWHETETLFSKVL